MYAGVLVCGCAGVRVRRGARCRLVHFERKLKTREVCVCVGGEGAVGGGLWARRFDLRAAHLYETSSSQWSSSGAWSIECSSAASLASNSARILVASASVAAFCTSAESWALSGRFASTMSSADGEARGTHRRHGKGLGK